MEPDSRHALQRGAVSREAGEAVRRIPHQTLVVAAPDEAGSAQVLAYSASGRQLLDSRIAAKKLTGATLKLPAHTAFVVVTSATATLHGAVRIESSRGVVTLPLEDAVTSWLIPSVRAAG